MSKEMRNDNLISEETSKTKRNIIIAVIVAVAVVAILAIVLVSIFAGRNNDSQQQGSNTPVVQQPEETEEPQQTVEPVATEEPVQTEEPVETEPADTTEETTEPVEETPEPEPEVEMVDFETWATQEGNDEVCLVVWNEKLKKQEIVQEYTDVPHDYIIEEGDRFAIPYNENIFMLQVNKKTIQLWVDEDNNFTNYTEIVLEPGTFYEVGVIYTDENGEEVYPLWTLK